MKKIETWKEIERRGARFPLQDGGVQVIYEFENYYIYVSDASYMPGGVSIYAEAIDRDSYFPSIYIESSFGQKVQEIKIQTTSWGALEISEIDKVIDCYKSAQLVAHEIKEAFPECFIA